MNDKMINEMFPFYEEYVDGLNEATGDWDADCDPWYDIISDEKNTKKWKPMMAEITKLVKKSQTKAQLQKVKEFLETKCKTLPGTNKVLKFISNMEAGKYKGEFKKFDGQHSQVSEFFSSLDQAVSYNRQDYDED